MGITLLPGQVIGGKYHVANKLGEGGMGAVYEAEDPQLGRRVAIKVLKLELTGSPNHAQRFFNEARAANKVKHPGVAQVTDHGRLDDGTPYLVIEYLQGESLDKRIIRSLCRNEPCLGVAHLWMVVDLLTVLAAAHAAGVVHRDIKPPNLFIIEDPSATQGERVIVLDFGIAKLPGADAMTASNVILGTMAYMAPEQARNAAKVSPKADVYAAGVLAYQLVTGRFPHEVEKDATAVALGVAKITDPPTPIEKYAPNLPPELRAWVMRMLRQNADKRPTAAEAEAEGRRVLGMAPRQTGSHDALVVRPTAPLPPPDIDTDEDYQDPTPSISPETFQVVLETLQPTPSEQHFRGERTPKDALQPDPLPPVERSPQLMNVPKSGQKPALLSPIEPAPQPSNAPISLSEMPSVPVAVALQAPTHFIKTFSIPSEERTVEAAPQPLPVALRALPDEQTPRSETPQADEPPQPAPQAESQPPLEPATPPPPNSRRAYGLAALAAIMVLSIGLTAIITRDSPKRAARIPVEPIPPSPVERPAPVAPPPAVGVPAAPLVTAPVKAEQNVSTAPTKDLPAPRDIATEPSKSRAGAKASKVAASKPCDPIFPTSQCIAPRLPKDKLDKFLRAFKESGTMLCPGEHLRLYGLPKRPGASIVPASMEKNPALTIRLTRTIIGLLSDEENFPHQVDIECPVH